MTGRLLAISTSSAALSVALFDKGLLRAHFHEVIGRGHAERLVTTVASVLAAAGVERADAVAVDIGPGSFTGVRIGIAAARALGLAWGAPVTGCRATALVAAAMLTASEGDPSVGVVIDAGRGHYYCETVDRSFAAGAIATVAGDAENAARLPDARAVLALPPAARALPPTALYVTPPDAVLPL